MKPRVSLTLALVPLLAPLGSAHASVDAAAARGRTTALPVVCAEGNVWIDDNGNGMLDIGECYTLDSRPGGAPSEATDAQLASISTDVASRVFAVLGGASYVYALAVDTKGNVVAKLAVDGKSKFAPAPIVELVIVDSARFKAAALGKPVTGVESFARFAFLEVNSKPTKPEDFKSLEAGLALATGQKQITVKRVGGKLTFSLPPTSKK